MSLIESGNTTGNHGSIEVRTSVFLNRKISAESAPYVFFPTSFRNSLLSRGRSRGVK